jgi:hypothetical protein
MYNISYHSRGFSCCKYFKKKYITPLVCMIVEIWDTKQYLRNICADSRKLFDDKEELQIEILYVWWSTGTTFEWNKCSSCWLEVRLQQCRFFKATGGANCPYWLYIDKIDKTSLGTKQKMKHDLQVIYFYGFHRYLHQLFLRCDGDDWQLIIFSVVQVYNSTRFTVDTNVLTLSYASPACDFFYSFSLLRMILLFYMKLSSLATNSLDAWSSIFLRGVGVITRCYFN